MRLNSIAAVLSHFFILSAGGHGCALCIAVGTTGSCMLTKEGGVP